LAANIWPRSCARRSVTLPPCARLAKCSRSALQLVRPPRMSFLQSRKRIPPPPVYHTLIHSRGKGPSGSEALESRTRIIDTIMEHTASALGQERLLLLGRGWSAGQEARRLRGHLLRSHHRDHQPLLGCLILTPEHLIPSHHMGRRVPQRACQDGVDLDRRGGDCPPPGGRQSHDELKAQRARAAAWIAVAALSRAVWWAPHERSRPARASRKPSTHMWWWCLAFGGGERVMVRVLRCLSRWGTWSPMQRGVELAPLPPCPPIACCYETSLLLH